MNRTEGDAHAVNAHCLKSVMQLARSRGVCASEDIYDSRGMKVVAKGASIDEPLYERLIYFKLRKPLEVCIDVADGVSPVDLTRLAQQSLDELPALAACLTRVNAVEPALEAVGAVRLDRVAILLLSMLGERDAELRHSVQVALIALGVATMLGLDRQAREALVIAALLHDVGELYIDTAFQSRGRRLTPQEWKNIAAHPRIGQLVVSQLTDYPKAVSQAIAEHHERENGFGYPRQLTGAKISLPGKILMVAEALAGAAGKGRKELRMARQALLVIPREFPHDIIAPLSRLLAELDLFEEDASSCPPAEQLLARQSSINGVIERTLDWIGGLRAEPSAADIADRVGERLIMLRSAAFSTGLSGYGDLAGSAIDASVETRLEAEALIGEIEWRLRELARLVWRKASTAAEQVLPFAEQLIHLLDDAAHGAPAARDRHPDPFAERASAPAG